MHPKSIEKVSESYLCCNCGACKVVCPKDAIEIRKTSIGRLYAQVTDRCIDCGVCTKVCPTLVHVLENPEIDYFTGSIDSVYVGKSTDETIFKNSQSGGACTALLTYLFDSGKIDAALVCRMDYGDPTPVVRPVMVTSVSELHATQKSCYTPVVLLENLKNELSKHNSVAVVGIGCHLEALSNIESLKKEVKTKIFCKIGLICDRTLCGTIQDVYSRYAPRLNPIKIIWRCKNLQGKNIRFRYEDAPLIITGKDGQYRQLPNLYRFLLKDMFTAPRCRVCPDKLNIKSDITLGDPWRMPDIDMENGESVIAIRSAKGKSIFDGALSAGYISASPRPVEQLIKGQLTAERKIQVSEYAAAFQVLNPTVSSRLLSPCIEAAQDGTDTARLELGKFVEREAMTPESIVKEAERRISRTLLRQSIVFRAARKILKVIGI